MNAYTAHAFEMKAVTFEMVESRGQEWLKVPDAWEWGLADFVIVHAQNCRLILCRVEQFTATSADGTPVAGGIRKVPIKVGELEVQGS